MQINRLNLDFWLEILNSSTVIVLFLITYFTLDNIAKEKENNKKVIAKMLLQETYSQVQNMIDNVLTEKVVKKYIVPKIDFDTTGEHDIITNLKNDPFINEKELYNLIGDGQLAYQDFLTYLEIKRLYNEYIISRIIVYDEVEGNGQLKHKLLKSLDDANQRLNL